MGYRSGRLCTFVLATAAAGSDRHVRNADAAVKYDSAPPRRTPEALSARLPPSKRQFRR
jgi:hypothetical protein